MGLVGYLVWRERGWRIRYFEEEFCHVSLWRVELPRNSHPDRTVQRALTTLRRHGVTRLLADDATLLPPVATGLLWRALAGQAALVELARRHIPPGQAFVGLRAKQVDRSVVACCTALAPVVRGLALEIPDCEGLAWNLQRRFGLPILAQGGDLTLNFTDSSTGIALSGDTPHPKGLTLSCPGVTLPGDCPREGLLAYLVEQGAVHWQDVRVLAAACHSTGLVL